MKGTRGAGRRLRRRAAFFGVLAGLLVGHAAFFAGASEASIESDSLALYTLSYLKGENRLAPVVSGTDNQPVLTFSRTETKSSGGSITSKYYLDFTRSFQISGRVSFPRRDGVSMALHTTRSKRAFETSYNTCVMNANMSKWNLSASDFSLPEGSNDVRYGLLWNYMQLTSDATENTRARAGAYSYRYQGTGSLSAFPDDESGKSGSIGVKNYEKLNTGGSFLIRWTCENPDRAMGSLTVTMGDTTFTYTGMDAAGVFGSMDDARTVYFTLATWAPNVVTDNTDNDFSPAQISVDKAYYLDTAAEDGAASTLEIISEFYADDDQNGTFETKIEGNRRLLAGRTVEVRNILVNRNPSSRPVPVTAAITELSVTTQNGVERVTALTDKALYWKEHGLAEETVKPNGIRQNGNGALNSADITADADRFSLPAPGDGTAPYGDACAVYEYRFVLPEEAAAEEISQTVQVEIAPFLPVAKTKAVSLDGTASVVLHAPENAVYDGTEKACTVEFTGASLTAGADYTLTYTGREGTEYDSADAPKNAGSYRAVFAPTPQGKSRFDMDGARFADFSIGRAVLTVTPADGQKKRAGDDDPALAFSIKGIVGKEKPAFTGALARKAGETAGSYAITLGSLTPADGTGGFLASNYRLVLDGAKRFRIEALPLEPAPPTGERAAPLLAALGMGAAGVLLAGAARRGRG